MWPPPSTQALPPTLASSTEFLYSGADPIQTGVAPGTIEPIRVAVLRGKVTDPTGTPLPGTTITILHHPEFGQTLSRTKGMFDLAVNGGGLLTVSYVKEGFLTAQRQVDVPWQDYIFLPDVVLIQVDSQVTAVDLTAAVPVQVAQGNVVTDADGTRQATLLFPQGTTAEMVMPDGSTQPISTLNVRATEYTVGENGPQAMPAELPPTSGYTYAVEFTVDQAMAAGATEVRFDQPLIHYVENFLDFPVGGIVPVGFYDRQQGQWVPSENGRIIQILSISGGLADLDIDGDGLADDAGALAALGITDDEREQLASLYSPGQSLWRVPITHFSPWDCNWPFSPGPNDRPPNQPRPRDPGRRNDPCQQAGSIIECQNQTLGERIGVVGTPFTLNYRSDRLPGRTDVSTQGIRLSGSSVPASLVRIVLEVEVAGQLLRQSFPPVPDQTFAFNWDGVDAYGRTLLGAQPAKVRIGYVYNGVFNLPAGAGRSFLAFGGAPITGSRTRRQLTIWQEFLTTRGATVLSVGSLDARSQGLGGWTLGVHHAYDPLSQTLYLGSGERRSADALPLIIDPIAGTLTAGFSGDGGPGTEAELSFPVDVAVGPDGSIYIADRDNRRIRRVGLDGIITTFAGGGSSREDGIPATEYALPGAESVAFGPDGNLYIGGGSSVLRVDSDGTISSVVTGFGRNGLAIAPDGSIYRGHNLDERFGGNRLYRLGTDGVVTVFAGTGERGYSGDGGPAAVASLSRPSDVAVGPDGSVYINDEGNDVIRRVGTDGIITTVAGTGFSGFSGDGGPATEARLRIPQGVAVAADGTLFISDFNGRIRRVGSDGIITSIAGGSLNSGFSGDGGPATQARLAGPRGITVAPDGSVHFADASFNRPFPRVRRVFAPLPGFTAAQFAIASEDGSELYQFDANGRHLSTINTLTGAFMFEFRYDGGGRLIAIEDGDGNVTTIERDALGNPTAVLAPFGQRTALSVDADGFLASIANPAGETTTFRYLNDGLLTAVTNPKGNTSSYDYDASGRLVRARDPAGGFQELARSDSETGHTVTRTTALGRVSTYAVEALPTGEFQLVNTDPNGASTEVLIGTDGRRVVTYPDGVTMVEVLGPDPRWGMQAPVVETVTVQTPDGRQVTFTTERAVTLADPDDLLSLQTLTETVTQGSRTSTRTFDAATGVITLRTPAGRERVARLDAQGRPVELLVVAGLDPVTATYDARGRVTEIRRGTQAQHYEYDAAGRVRIRRDGVGGETLYAYDDADRLSEVVLPSGHRYQFGYDANGNRTQVTMARGGVHQLAYAVIDKLAGYTAPGAGTLAASYDIDRRRERVVLPGGRTQEISYDAGGRPTAITYPEATVSFVYGDATQRLKEITRTPAGGGLTRTVAYAYDGNLPTQMRMQGMAQGTYTYRHADDFRLAGMQLDTEPELAILRDEDGLVTAYGPFTISRDGPGGLLSQLTDDTLVVGYVFNGAGRLAQQTHTVAGKAVYGLELFYDNDGRLVRRVETKEGTAHSYDYVYDPDGQLTDVTLDGASIESYSYDANGNRTQAGTATATYDNQDRLVEHGGVPYTFDADGFLSGRGGDSFTYSARGELLEVSLAGRESVAYAYDGFGRRVARTDAAGTTQYLYGDPGNLFLVTAMRAPDGTLTTYFYDDARLVVAFERAGQRFYVATDQVGSPRVVTDAAGQVVKLIDYDSFGVVTADTDPGFELGIGFAGGLAEPVKGLVRFGLRDYDPAAGRWTARDPVLFAGGQANLYVYVANDPVARRDPTGLFCVGGSAYAGVGAGTKLCFDADGEWSWCIEVGFGAGGGLDVGPWGGVAGQADKQYIEASGKFQCGPLSIGASVKLDNCGDPIPDFSCGVGPFDPCAKSVGGEDLNKDWKDSFKKAFKCKAEAKLVGGACIGSKIN